MVAFRDPTKYCELCGDWHEQCPSEAELLQLTKAIRETWTGAEWESRNCVKSVPFTQVPIVKLPTSVRARRKTNRQNAG